jgi:hypothetical protein
MWESFANWVWGVLEVIGVHRPDDIISYSTYIRADWYYRGVPGLSIAAILLLIAVIFCLVVDWIPRLKKRLRKRELRRQEAIERKLHEMPHLQ